MCFQHCNTPKLIVLFEIKTLVRYIKRTININNDIMQNSELGFKNEKLHASNQMQLL